MSLVQDYGDVRKRLLRPRNAVRDDGIDLMRHRRGEPPPKKIMTEDGLVEPWTLKPPINYLISDDEYTERFLRRWPVPRKDEVGRVIQVKTIQLAVCRKYDIRFSELISPRRDQRLVRARQIAAYLAKILTMRSFPDLGRRFGGRDHTTILHSVRKINGLIQDNTLLREEIQSLHDEITASLRESHDAIALV